MAKVEIRDEVREVEVVEANGFVRLAEPLALCRVGRGAKLWPERVYLRKVRGVYVPESRQSVANKAATVVAWNDEEYSNLLSRHNRQA